jgi:predicted ThiF/HesA family dinucleotide-utilizing enzyme
VHMPQAAVSKGIAALLGVPQKLVTAWFGQQRARERTAASASQADENMIVAVHSMDEMVSVDEMQQFVDSVRIVEQSGGRLMPARAAIAPTTKLAPTATLAAEPGDSATTTTGVRIVRSGADNKQNTTAAAKRTRKKHTPEQVRGGTLASHSFPPSTPTTLSVLRLLEMRL